MGCFLCTSCSVCGCVGVYVCVETHAIYGLEQNYLHFSGHSVAGDTLQCKRFQLQGFLSWEMFCN